MELLEHFAGDHCGIPRFSFRAVRVWSRFRAIAHAVREMDAICESDAICSNALLSLATKRWGNRCWFALGRNEIMYDILDEETFALVL